MGALLNHDPPAARRDHFRDNVKAMRQKARQQAQRQEEAAQEKPLFKLQKFDNVPSRFRRPSSAPISRSDAENRRPEQPAPWHSRRMSNDSPASPAPSPGWRVSSGYGTLSSPKFEPCASPPATPQRATTKTAQARAFSTPAKSPKSRAPTRASPVQKPTPADSNAEAGSEEEFFSNFKQVAKDLKDRQGKHVPAKDAQGRPTRLQYNRASPEGPLSHCGEHVPVIPLGYRLAPEEERQQTLEGLKLKLIQLNDQYCRLPLRIETQGQRRQQEMLRTKIRETENAVNVFSRPSVLVEICSHDNQRADWVR